jgi:hypothetical protein
LFNEFGVPPAFTTPGAATIAEGQLFANVGAKDGALPAGYSCRQVMDNGNYPGMLAEDPHRQHDSQWIVP